MSSTTLPLSLPHITLLISNMHCTSCCESITHLLSTISSIKDTSISLLLHTVTFAVDTSLSSSTSEGPVTIGKVVKDAMQLLRAEGGFDVVAELADGRSVNEKKSSKEELSTWLNKLGLYTRVSKEKRRAEDRRKKHLEHCQVCQAERDVRASPSDQAKSSAQEKEKDSQLDEGIVKTTVSIEGMTCASCVNSITSALKASDSVISADINLLGSSGTVKHQASLPSVEIVQMIEDTGFDAVIIRSERESFTDEGQTPRWKSTFTIEGMTCASCSGAITTSLKGREGIESVHIDLLGHSGIIVHTSAISVDELKELIEDVGYDAELSSTEPLNTVNDKGKGKANDGPQLRSIQIHIEGMFCHDCVRKVNAYLDTLPVETYTPVAFHSPIVTVTYLPHQPLTIRTLLDGISGIAPEFEAEMMKTQSLNERSRMIQKREVKVLAWHCVAAIVFAIPTFVIGIVGMALVKGHTQFKMDIMKPVWGAANLGTIILWPLATLVQFGVGRLFYKRAFGSLWPHLRRLIPSTFKSKKMPPRPLTWRTLISFGSMDLLVVLSTSVSYFSSLAMLILDVKTSPDSESIGTYFDSGVFIIMFILLGRTLEAYAKSRTTDAVSVLGTLRPDTALLVERESELVDSLQRAGSDGTESDDGKRYSEDTQASPEELKRGISTASMLAEVESSTDTRPIPINQLEIGDVLLLPPGSLPPTDGVLVTGNTTFDESSLTGESHPIHKSAGDEIFTGTVNLSSAITFRVTHLAEDTMLERIIRAVSDASSRKAPLELIAERLTGVFVPIIVYFALAVLVVWLSLSLTGTVDTEDKAGGRVFFALEFAIACLVVACPCGIGLAVPCANAVGNGVAAKAGILASGGGEAFLAATKITRVVFDKTGTLTVGKSVVTDEEWFLHEDAGKELVKRGVKEVERGSTHPLAVGLVEHLGRSVLFDETEKERSGDTESARSKTPVEILATAEAAGRGLKATFRTSDQTSDLLVGNVAHMSDHGIVLDAMQKQLVAKWSSEAKSVVLVASRLSAPSPSNNEPIGIAVTDNVRVEESTTPYTLAAIFSLSDPPRATSSALIASLRDRGLGVSMLSGDNEATARAVGAMVGLKEDEVRGGVGPEGKAEAIREMQQLKAAKKGKRAEREMVMFVGDGLNDSVALAAADVSVAMGHGSQATLASADFVLLSSDLVSLLPLLRISRKVIRRQRLNLVWALLFNVVCLPFAAGVFYAAGGIRLTPVWSAVLMALSSVSVVGSSLAMRWGF